MIQFTSKEGKAISVNYNEVIEAYQGRYNEVEGAAFVRNMMALLDNWEDEKGLRFRRVSGSDWQQLLLAVQ